MNIIKGNIYKFNNSIHLIYDENNGVYYTLDLKNGSQSMYNEYNLISQAKFLDVTDNIDINTFNRLVKYIKKIGEYTPEIKPGIDLWKIGDTVQCVENKYANKGKISISTGLRINGHFIIRDKQSSKNLIIQ